MSTHQGAHKKVSRLLTEKDLPRNRVELWAYTRYRKRVEFAKQILDHIADLREEKRRITCARVAQRYYGTEDDRGRVDPVHKSRFDYDLKRRHRMSFKKFLAAGKRFEDLSWEQKNDLTCMEMQGAASGLHRDYFNKRGPAKGSGGRQKKKTMKV